MTYQPDDISHYSYDDSEFHNLDTELSLHGYSQNAYSQPKTDFDDQLPSSFNEVSAKNDGSEYFDELFDQCTTSSLTPFHSIDLRLFPDYQLEQSEIDNFLEGPANEITVTATPIDTDNDNLEFNFDTQSELNPNEHQNSVVDEIKKHLVQDLDPFFLQIVDDSIQQRTMAVETQPPATLRPRYKSDGLRQIEKARTKPMAVQLPDLTNIGTDLDVQFYLRLGLTSYSKNPLDPVYHHANKFEYHSNGVIELKDGTVCVPISPDEINDGKKGLPRSAIIKTKLDLYKSQLVQYSQVDDSNTQGENKKVTVKQAKIIFNQFNLKDSRISCQLMIKRNDTWHFTNIVCETHVIESKEQSKSTQKRPADSIDSDDDESLDEHPTTSKSTKRMKHSH